MKKSLLPLLIFFCSIIWPEFSNAQNITTVAGNGVGTFAGDGGLATAASLSISWGVAFDSAGNIYIGDGNNARIRKVNTAGTISTIAGNGVTGYGGDAGPAISGKLNFPSGVEADTFGNIYIADANNHRIRKVNNAGIITTIAGTGVSGFSGDGGPATAAQIVFSDGICADQYGNVFIPDPSNHRIRKINTAGIITTYAGTGAAGSGGDGGMATAATVDWPSDMDVDLAGNLYFTDYNRNVARKITPAGIITTIAGTGVAGFSGDNGPATAGKLNGPVGIDIDECDNIYIGDRTNNRVRMISNTGIITTIAGNGGMGFAGDGGPATAAQLNYPHAVCRNKNYVYFIDRGNYRLRKVQMTNAIPAFTGGISDTISGCGGTALSLTTALSVYDSNFYQRLTWTLLSAPLHGVITGLPATGAANGAATSPTGIYYTGTTGYFGTDSFRVVVSDCFSADTITIYVLFSNITGPIGAITGPSTLCIGSSISLNDTSSGGTWSLSNSNASISTGGIVTGITTGTDTAYYTITTGCGTSTASFVFTITAPPAPATLSGPSSVCPGGTISITPSVSGGTWAATNSTASVSLGSVTGITPGTDTIRYTITNSCGSTASSVTVTINTLPTISVPSASVCTGTTTTLSASGATTYTWSPSAGISTTTGTTVTFTPGATTVYTITGTSAAGCTATTTATVTVNAPPPPPVVTSPVTYCFAATPSPLTATGTALLWYTSATGGTGSSVAPIPSTGSSGSVTYWVSQTLGCESTRVPITVTILPQVVAAFTTSTIYGCTYDTVRLLNASTGSVTWIWTISDGTTTTATSPTHIFASQDTYTVTLITFNGSCSDTATRVIDLHHTDSAAFSLQQYTCVGTLVSPNNQSNVAAPATYYWNFGDGGSSTAPSPAHTYSTSGTYTVTLIAGNSIPCYDTFTRTITVDTIATVDLSITSSDSCTNNNISAAVTITGTGYTTTDWALGDGTSMLNTNSVTHTFAGAGEYVITTTSHFRACPDVSASFPVSVNAKPYVNLGPDLGICETINPLVIADQQNATNLAAQWHWNTGATTSSIQVDAPGLYEVIVKIGACYASDYVEVYSDCATGFPNVFSPNGDGINDVFDPRDFLSKELLYYEMTIYNRWGEIVYFTDKTTGKGWEGTFHNEPQPQGVFVYVLKARFYNGQTFNKNGNHYKFYTGRCTWPLRSDSKDRCMLCIRLCRSI